MTGDTPRMFTDVEAARTWLAGQTMDRLLALAPSAAEVLAEHGVDPRSRCHVAARRHMTLRQVLGRTCPVDDVDATFDDLADHLLRHSDRSPRATGPEPKA